MPDGENNVEGVHLSHCGTELFSEGSWENEEQHSKQAREREISDGKSAVRGFTVCNSALADVFDRNCFFFSSDITSIYWGEKKPCPSRIKYSSC